MEMVVEPGVQRHSTLSRPLDPVTRISVIRWPVLRSYSGLAARMEES